MRLDVQKSKAYVYRGQNQPQSRYYQIRGNGSTVVAVNAEIGNAVPMQVWEGMTVRLSIPRAWDRKAIERFYMANKPLFCEIDKSIAKDGVYLGSLGTDDPKECLELLLYND